MKYLGDLEKNLWRFGENIFGDLEKTCSVIWRKRVWRFGENVYGENIGDLEKRGQRSYGNFVLVFVMEWRRARRP